MKRTCFLMAIFLGQTGLPAQQRGSAFQSTEWLAGALPGGRGGPGTPALTPRSESGKPFSATAVTRTEQTLSDGTRLTQTTTVVQYRDVEGRVRTETTAPGEPSSEPGKVITIRDPLAGLSYRLDPAKKTAVKSTMGGDLAGGARGGPAAAGGAPSEGARGGRRGPAVAATEESAEAVAKLRAAEKQLQAAARSRNTQVEDLGMATVNGVPAQGTRTTNVVPAGAIGNDREFRSVIERWFSADLNLLIKSVSTDPRFGNTTYELTNISRQPPDSSLFRVPADYAIINGPALVLAPVKK